MITVRTDTPSVSAVSSTLNPPKKRNSITWLGLGFTTASAVNASSSAITSTSASGAATSWPSSDAAPRPPPRDTAARRLGRGAALATGRRPPQALATLGRAPRASRVDQHAPHHPRGGGEKVRPALPVDGTPIEQPDVGCTE